MAAAALRLVYVGLAAQRIGSMVGYLRAHPRRTFGQIEKARVVIARFLLWVVKRKREERRRRAAPVIYAACRRFMLVSRRAKRARAVPVILATLLDAQQKSLVLARMKWVRNVRLYMMYLHRTLTLHLLDATFHLFLRGCHYPPFNYYLTSYFDRLLSFADGHSHPAVVASPQISHAAAGGNGGATMDHRGRTHHYGTFSSFFC